MLDFLNSPERFFKHLFDLMDRRFLINVYRAVTEFVKILPAQDSCLRLSRSFRAGITNGLEPEA